MMTQGYENEDFQILGVDSINSWGTMLSTLVALTEPVKMDEIPPLEEDPETST